MNFPINYSFVTTKTLEIDDDGVTELLDVLVLDKKANEAYWKKIGSFKKVADSVESLPLQWKMNKSFVDMAVQDLINEESNGEEATIFGLPISLAPDPMENPPACVLILENGTEIVNDFWK